MFLKESLKWPQCEDLLKLAQEKVDSYIDLNLGISRAGVVSG